MIESVAQNPLHSIPVATDNAIVRFDGTSGNRIQDYLSSAPTIDDNGILVMNNILGMNGYTLDSNGGDISNVATLTAGNVIVSNSFDGVLRILQDNLGDDVFDWNGPGYVSTANGDNIKLFINGSAQFSGGACTIDDLGKITANTGIFSFLQIASILNSGGDEVIEVDNTKLRIPAGAETLDWASRILMGTGGNTSVDWENKFLNDVTGAISMDWDSRFVRSSLGIVTIDWENDILQDSTGGLSLSWNDRVSSDSVGNTSINWDTRKLIGVDGSSTAMSWDTLGVFLGTSTGRLSTYLRASGALNFGSTAAGTSTDLTITLTGAILGDGVILGIPNGATLANGVFTAWVSAADTVKVRFTNTNLVTALDPVSGTFKVQIFR